MSPTEMETFLFEHATHDLRLDNDRALCVTCAVKSEGNIWDYEDEWGEGYGRLLTNKDPNRADVVELALHKLTCIAESGCKCMLARPIEQAHTDDGYAADVAKAKAEGYDWS